MLRWSCASYARRLEGGLEGCPLPRDGVSWQAGDWVQELEASGGAQGWCYARNFARAEWQLEPSTGRVVRRRAWVRAYLVACEQEESEGLEGSSSAPPTPAPVAASEGGALHDMSV